MKGLFPRGLRPLVILAVLTVFASTPALAVDGEEPNVAAKAQAAGVGTDQDDPLAAVISDLESNKSSAPAATPVVAPQRRSRSERLPAEPQIVGELPEEPGMVSTERGTVIPYIPDVPPGEKPVRHPHRAWQAPSMDPPKYEGPEEAAKGMDVSYPPEYQPRLYQDATHIPAGVEVAPSYDRPAFVPPAPVTPVAPVEVPAPMPAPAPAPVQAPIFEPGFEAPAPAPMPAPRAPERSRREDRNAAAEPQVLREIQIDGSAPMGGSHPVVPYLPAPTQRSAVPAYVPAAPAPVAAPVMEAPAPAPVVTPAPVGDPAYSMPSTRPTLRAADPEPVMIPEPVQAPAPAPRTAPPAQRQAPASTGGDLFLDGPVTDIPTHSGPPTNMPTHSGPVHNEPAAAPEDTLSPASAGPSFIPPPPRAAPSQGPRPGVTPLEDNRVHPPAGALDFSSPEGISLLPEGQQPHQADTAPDAAHPDDTLMPLQLQPYDVTSPQLIPSQPHGQTPQAMPPQGYQPRPNPSAAGLAPVAPAAPVQAAPSYVPPSPAAAGYAPQPAAYGSGNIIGMVNSARAMGSMCGSITMPRAEPLRENATLTSLATQHASDMATRGYFSSTTPEGQTLGARLTAAGYNWGHFASNIAAKTGGPQQTLNLWMQKPGQCSNIMGAEFTEAGYGTDPSGRYSVMILAAPVDEGSILLR